MTELLSAGDLDPDAPWCRCGFANYSAGPCEVCGWDDQLARYGDCTRCGGTGLDCTAGCVAGVVSDG